ncbi:hypothetical protein GF325_09560 [Candidatus Bathyarchaeota archaeon]|nr:hypothetical protein [Candidatus Bathyarchaeota archaeon]
MGKKAMKPAENQGIDEEMQQQVKANVLLSRARAQYNEGEYRKSINTLKEILEILPENASIWFELALSYRESSEFDEEIKCYKRIIHLGADDAEMWLNMALAFRIIGKPSEELYCLIMAADKGVDYEIQGDAKLLVVDRYQQLTRSMIQAKDPMSNEYFVPVYDDLEDDAPDQGNCMVCFEKVDKIKEEGQLLVCPHCKRIAHFICLASWLQNNEICPVCHNILDFSLDNYDFKQVMGISGDEDDEACDPPPDS